MSTPGAPAPGWPAFPVPEWPALSDGELRGLLDEIANDKQRAEFARANDLDFAYGLPEVARFRCNFFVEEKGAAAVFRIIPEKIVPLAELNLPAAVNKVVELR